jgi:DNA polymerase III subunit gamma/tau
MTYKVLARKYRPSRFDQLVGQEHIARSLNHAIKRNQVAHAYLFSGARGVGKTSVARIFSQALNCMSVEGVEPCGACENCLDIGSGNSFFVWEIDGASNNSVDDVRRLIESCRNAVSSNYQYRVFIIDEVHMLSMAAFNALLKTLEEPPSQTVFILATTEVHKLPETVLSRCQRYDFRLLPAQLIQQALRDVLSAEGISHDDGVVSLISRLAEGSLRDGLSLLDRLVAYSPEHVSLSDASNVLGVVNKNTLFELSEAIINRDVGNALGIIDKLSNEGSDTSLLLREFVIHWRELLLAKHVAVAELFKLNISEMEATRLKGQVEALDTFDLQELNNTAREESDRALRGLHPWYALEALVVRMATRERYVDLETLFASSLTSSNRKDARQVNLSENSLLANSANKVTSSGDNVVGKSVSRTDSIKNVENSRCIGREEFMQFAVASKRAPFLVESLKRVVIGEFKPGYVLINASSFDYRQLADANNMQNLKGLLEDYSGLKDWRVELQEQDRKDSLSSPDQVSNVNDGREKMQESDRVFEVLEEVFPGCRLE